MRKKTLLILVVCILAVSIPLTIALIHQGQEPSNGGTAEVPSDNSTTEPTVPPTNHSTLTMLSITEGDVFIMKAGTDSWIEAQVGMSLKVGDTIKSGDSSSAEITFFDGSTIELEAGTEIEVVSLGISDTGSTTIKLKQAIGNTISRVTKLVDSASSYEVETPACVAAVRGSSMLVQVIADGTSWVTNLEGEIWVTVNGVELQIPEGRKCIIIFGQLPQLVPLSGGGGGGGGGGFSPDLDIAITKIPSVMQAHEDDTITYTYTVTNHGNVPLSNVSVTDDTIKNVTYQSGDTNGDDRLGTDETWVFTANYTITDGDATPLVNTAAASGTYGGSLIIIDWTTASVDVLRPIIALTKTADRTQAHDGDTITYTYTITNPGNTPLSDVLVTDDTIEDVTYQNGDTNDDSKLDTNETWTFIADYIVSAEDPSSLVNTATVYGTDALAKTVESEEDTASVDILRPVVVRFPDEGTAYIGYEDLPGYDFFDYNDFGMEMSIEEVYNDDCLTEINMEFESVIKDSDFNHDIHILRTLFPSTSYDYTIERSTAAQGTETPELTNESGQGDFDIILFDTSYFTSGDRVTIHIEITAGYEPYVATPEPPRWDLASIWAYYDPYMNYRYIDTEHHIGDWQPAVVPRLPTDGYDVPYILVIPVTGWEAPPAHTCITVVYPYFDDYYLDTVSPENWYEMKAS